MTTTYELAENELGFMCSERDAKLGLSGSGFESNGVSVWDDARSNREHIARWWQDRTWVQLERRVLPLWHELGAESQQAVMMAWSTCSAAYCVTTFFATQTFRAPLVGLGLLAWRELKPDDDRAPQTIVDAWEGIVRTNSSALRKVKVRTLALYEPIVRRYEELRRVREDAARLTRRERKAKIQAERAEYFASLKR